MIKIGDRTSLLACILLGCGLGSAAPERESPPLPFAKTGTNELSDSLASPSVKANLDHVVTSVNDLEIDGVIYQLNIRCASRRPDSLDLTFRIALECVRGSVFDIAVSKEEFGSYLSESALSQAGLVDLKFNKRERNRHLFTTHTGLRYSTSMDRIDYTIECVETAKCGILSWSVNGTSVMQACWG